jgi:Putative Ig domain
MGFLTIAVVACMKLACKWLTLVANTPESKTPDHDIKTRWAAGYRGQRMITRFATFSSRMAALFTLVFTIAACGGGGSGGGGFLGESDDDAPSVPSTPVRITTTALPVGTDGLEYTALVEADGGTLPYQWEVLNDGGTGFTIDNDGFLTGTAPPSGQYGLTLQVTDNEGQTDKASFILTVAGDAQQPLAIATTALPNGIERQDYITLLQAVGGQGEYMWTLVDGGGTGLDLRDDGLLSGTAPDAGQYAMTIAVQDDVREVSSVLILTVTTDSSPLNITTTALPAGTEDVRYAAILNASGGDEPYTWNLLSNGGLSGLNVTAAGVLQGTPGFPGTFGLVFEVRDARGDTDQQAITLTINPEAGATIPLKIATASLPDASRVLYAAAVEATGGIKPYTWSGGDTSTPGTGFVVDPTSGSITGNTNNLLPGQYGYSVTVTDDDGDSDTRSYIITVPGGDTAPITILTESPLPTAYEDLFYTVIMRSVGGGGNSSLTWSVIDTVGFPGTAPSFGNSPDDEKNGVLTWGSADIVEGNYLITIQVTDGIDSDVVTYDLQATVAPVRITTTNPLPNAIEGEDYTRTIAVSGGGADNTWSVLSVTPAPTVGPDFVGPGIMDGTLTWGGADIEEGSYEIEVQVVSKDANGVASSDTKTFDLDALPATP